MIKATHGRDWDEIREMIFVIVWFPCIGHQNTSTYQ